MKSIFSVGKPEKAKKGMVDTQFHWLFVLLAGGFILFLFAIFIQEGITANNEKQTALMLQYFDSVFSSSQNSQHLDEKIDSLSSISIEQVCEPGVDSHLRFVDQALDKKTTFISIFSSQHVSGATYAIKTLPHDVPFHVDNPIYLTDSNTLYVIFSEDSDAREKYTKLLPSYATVVATDDLSTIKIKGFRGVVIITENYGQLILNQNGVASTDLPDALTQTTNLRQVDITTATNNADFYFAIHSDGNIIFLQPGGQGSDLLSGKGDVGNVTYTDDASLLGSIMSDDPMVYECNEQKLNVRARAVALQIAIRAQTLSVEPNIDSRCVASYTSAHDDILQGLASDTLLQQSWQDQIGKYNQQLIDWSCPTLY